MPRPTSFPLSILSSTSSSRPNAPTELPSSNSGRSRRTQPILVFFVRGHLQVCGRQRRRLDLIGDFRPSSRSLRSGANRQFAQLQRPSDHRGHVDAGTHRRACYQRDNLTGCLDHGPRWSDVHAGRRLGVRLGRAPRRCFRLSHGRNHNVAVSNATAVVRQDAGADAGHRQWVRFSRTPTPRPTRTSAISIIKLHSLPATPRQPEHLLDVRLVDVLSSANPLATPEPTTWAMMLLGFGGMTGVAAVRRSLQQRSAVAQLV